MKGLRVYHSSDSFRKPFFVYVDSVKEGEKVMDILRFYDWFLRENHIKPDCSDTRELQLLQRYNKKSEEWEEWDIATENHYFDDVREYLLYDKETEEFAKMLRSQLKGGKP